MPQLCWERFTELSKAASNRLGISSAPYLGFPTVQGIQQGENALPLVVYVPSSICKSKSNSFTCIQELHSLLPLADAISLRCNQQLRRGSAIPFSTTLCKNGWVPPPYRNPSSSVWPPTRTLGPWQHSSSATCVRRSSFTKATSACSSSSLSASATSVNPHSPFVRAPLVVPELGSEPNRRKKNT